MVRAAGRAEGSARASVWLEGKARDGRGRQPSGLDRERITGTAVRLLDAEGLGKFSMRRLAAELNVTAMSVYWYVDTKDDLLELALDQAFDEMRLPRRTPTRTGGTNCARSPGSTGRSWSATPGCHRSRAPSSTSARTRSTSHSPCSA